GSVARCARRNSGGDSGADSRVRTDERLQGEADVRLWTRHEEASRRRGAVRRADHPAAISRSPRLRPRRRQLGDAAGACGGWRRGADGTEKTRYLDAGQGEGAAAVGEIVLVSGSLR